MVDATVHFDAAFEAFQCSFELKNFGDQPRTYRDRFDDYGLVSVSAPGVPPNTPLVVSAAKGRLSLDFRVAAREFFLLPRGRYDRIEVLVAGRAKPWLPPLEVGLQGLWDTTLAGNSSEAELVILEPEGGQRVEQVVTVSGRAHGLEGAQVEIVVVSDTEYPQGHTVVRNACWDVPRVVLGRPDADQGTAFRIKAVSRSSRGEVVEAQALVVRK